MSPEQIAQAFHETYERLAPDHGYETREASAKPWDEVPESNRNLMVAVAAELVDAGVIPTFPRRDGDVTVLGPEVFASADGSVISVGGENYVRQAADVIGKAEVKTYLDQAIRSWRGLRDGTVEPHPPLTPDEAREKAPQYIDAFQSMRVSLLGRQLP